MDGNSRGKMVKVGHRVRKVRKKSVRKKKRVIKHKARRNIEHKTCKARGT